jgi:PPP family 3-phenylpropionic acid transporter
MILVADVTALEGAHLAGTSYGKLRLWGSLGFLGAVVLAARFVDPNERMALPLATSVALLAALLASLGIPDRAKLPRLGNEVLASPNFKLLLFSAFLGQCAHAGYDLCFTLHLFDLGMSRNAIGLAWAIGTAFEVALMASASRAFRGLAPAPLLAFALGSAALRWTILASVRSPAIILLLQPLHALSFGLMWLAAVGYAQERAPAHSLGTAQGLLSTAFGAGSVTGMLLWGPAYQRGGGTLVFASAAFVAAFASACAAALAGLDRKLRARSEAE